MDETETNNDQIVEPSVSQEEMDTFIKSLEDGYGPTVNLSTLLPQGSVTEDTSDDDDEEKTGEGEQTPTPDDDPSNADEFVTINGQQHARSDIERLLEFDKYLRSNSDVAQRVAQAVQSPGGQSTVSETTSTETDKVEEFTAPTPPEGLDMDDPRDKILWDTHVASLRTSWENRQELIKVQKTFQQEQSERLNRQAAEDMNTALAKFRSTFTALNDDDIATIRKEAGMVLPGVIQSMGHSPEALYRAMEIAGYANADLRTRMTNEEPKHQTARQRSETRKRKLGSLSGAPASAPKEVTRPVYRNDRDMVQQFADALANEGMGR